MAFTRSKKERLKAGARKTEWRPDEADSTVAHWPAPLPKRRRVLDHWERNDGVDWQNGLPEGPLLRMFELLHAEGTDEAKAAMHSAAAACTQWREAFWEVVLGDTAASRPERPALPRDDTQDKKPLATTATTCAAVCEPSASETNGFEASSGQRQQAPAEAAAAATVATQTTTRPRSRLAASQAFAAARAFHVAAAAAAQGQDQQPRRRSRVALGAGQQEQQPQPQLPLLRRVRHSNAHLVAETAQPPAAATGGQAMHTLAAHDTADVLHGLHQAAAAAMQRQVTGRNRATGRAGLEQQLQKQAAHHVDDLAQPPAAAAAGRRTRRRSVRAPVDAAGAAATDETVRPADTTDEQQEEVMQPTTGQNDAAAAGRRRSTYKVRSSGNAAAAAHGEQHRGQQLEDQEHTQHAGRRRRRRSQQQHEPQLQEPQQQDQPAAQQQQQQQQQQDPADSTEAQEVGQLAGQRAASSQGRQGSGSNRQEGWLGHIAHALQWLRGGSS